MTSFHFLFLNIFKKKFPKVVLHIPALTSKMKKKLQRAFCLKKKGCHILLKLGSPNTRAKEFILKRKSFIKLKYFIV